MPKKRIFGILTLSAFCVFGMVGCANGEKGGLDPEIRLNANSQLVFVGETITLKANLLNDDNLEDKTLVWVSSNNSLATVDNGVVTGVSEGTVTITVALNSDLSVRASFELQVVNRDETIDSETEFELVISSLPTKIIYTQGTYLDLTGLTVTKVAIGEEHADIGEVVTNYTTNPKDGTYLSNIGTFEIVVSSPGCKSASFEYEVIEAPTDESFVNVLTLIDDEDEKYQLDIDLSLQTTSGLTHITTRETYTPTAYYYQAFDSQGVETQAYGFAEGGIVRDENNQTIHRRGVFRFTLDENDQVVPGVYYNHGSNVYATSASNKVVSKIEALDPDLAPTRLIDDSYFNVTDSEYISNLLAQVGLAASNATLLDNVKAFVDSETSFRVVMTFVNDIGTLTYNFSNIGAAVIPSIQEYLDSGKAGADGPEEMLKVAQAANLNNYSVNLGQYDTGLVPLDIGRVYYTENYMYCDYTEDFISYMTALDSSQQVVDYGYVMVGEEIYSFTAPFTDGHNEVMLSSEPVNSSRTIPQYCGYISQLDLFDDTNLDYFEAGQLNANYSGYMAYYRSLCEDVNEVLGFDTSETYEPFSTGVVNVVRNSEDEIDEFGIFYAVRASGGISFYVRTFEDIGETSFPVMEDFLGNTSN